MGRYRVHVWIDDIEVEADSEDAAIDRAIEMVDNGDVRIRADYAEVQSQIVSGGVR